MPALYLHNQWYRPFTTGLGAQSYGCDADQGLLTHTTLPWLHWYPFPRRGNSVYILPKDSAAVLRDLRQITEISKALSFLFSNL